MSEKSKIIEVFFDNKISPKMLKKFKQKTPQGNYVSGWLCVESGEFLSSMVLTEIQTKDEIIFCNRFIRGMPKQHYYDEHDWNLYQDDKFTIYRCNEKVDGTCLMLYALYDLDDNLIEIVPRTRGMAVAANHIIDMYNLIDKAQIEDFFSLPHHYDYVLMFELFGILNRHEITYHQTYIDLRLIGASLDGEMLSEKEVSKIAFDHHFAMADRLFELCCYNGIWKIWGFTSRLFPYYIDRKIVEDKTYDSLGECIEGVAEILEIINNNYKQKNNHIAVEGIVINGIDANQNQRYIKLKPKSVLKMAKLGNGIPNYAIRKEVYKYFDEYGVIKVKEIYNEDKLDFVNFVQKNLLEEFPEEFVKSSKTVKKINNIFFDIWEKKTPDLTVQKISQELADKYSGYEISEVMRIFAKEYPSFKNKSKIVYSILTYLIKEE